MRFIIILSALFVLTSCNTKKLKQEVAEPPKAVVETPKVETAKKEMTKFMYIDLANGLSKKHMCEIDVRVAKCTGSTSVNSCKDNIQRVYPYCSERLLKVMPEIIPNKQEATKYGTLLAQCLTFQMANVQNMTPNEVNACFKDVENRF
ncbi:hypothetical protein [Pleionea sp. CnH1-48]|uniref:hypothetical protein n=1 Tax=Pleionea sp. CnH1-48 TaxID=2954494 RepID=UPI00209833D0|nr:hypothetical protein [Pleionea sp. CnH1-48]MCO7224122.1 hypothetical protein [Pleionea sp. CnH1-48]